MRAGWISQWEAVRKSQAWLSDVAALAVSGRVAAPPGCSQSQQQGCLLAEDRGVCQENPLYLTAGCSQLCLQPCTARREERDWPCRLFGLYSPEQMRRDAGKCSTCARGLSSSSQDLLAFRMGDCSIPQPRRGIQCDSGGCWAR